MKIGGRWSSGNVRDRRGMGPGMVGGGLGAVVLTILALVFGVDPGVVTQGDPNAGQQEAPAPPADDPAAEMVRRVLGTTEGVWSGIFQEEFGQDYPEPQLVLFSGSVQSACGFAQAAMGPFYCPLDRQVYIDLSFWRDLEQLGGGGDFAQAYVVAHEIGHHVQTVTGISEEVQRERQRVSEVAGNELSVRQELQADCFAGVWANRVGALQDVVIDPGDVEEALAAATAIGDDRLQRQSQGYVVPESFTHGSSAQRMSWFQRGFRSGEIGQCDTFSGRV